MHVLIANRGEIAARIVRTARELGIEATAVHAQDDRDGSHLTLADHVIALPGSGPGAYLDQSALLAAAAAAGADAVHPGYGFLSESATFAHACQDAHLTFIGPEPTTLRLLGDKVTARAAATRAGLPVLDATAPGVTPDDLAAFLDDHPDGVMIKAVAGGGGRGIRPVHAAADLRDAFRHCAAEALAGFGDDRLFAEALLPLARHIEVQIAGDGGEVVVLGDRDCSVQRRHQKLLEIAPARDLTSRIRNAMHEDAARLAASLGYQGLGTVEFLVRHGAGGTAYAFLEVNPRIQVEHPVTEAVTGLDLVAIQFGLAAGKRLGELGLDTPPAPRGIAIEARVNAEGVDTAGQPVPSSGTASTLVAPTGAGVRIDTHLRPGAHVSALYDSLLVKVITHTLSDDFSRACEKTARALEELVIDGVQTNQRLLIAMLADPELRSGPVDTAWLGRRLAELTGPPPAEAASTQSGPLLISPMPGVVVEHADPGREYPAGTPLVTIEAMKLRHLISAPRALVLERLLVAVGDTVQAGQSLASYAAKDATSADATTRPVDLDAVPVGLATVRELHAIGTDAARAQAVGRRHAQGRRMARENIADLVDDGSLREYGPLVVAAQSSRYNARDLRESTPADGLIAGLATVGGVPAVVMSYDYTVLAGTQGARSHAKTDRMVRLAHERGLPVVIFPEGGGGRPGDVDAHWLSGLDVTTFHAFGALRGRVPLIAVVSGRCFAGNAALAGMCDIVIATPDATIGMAGPALIEGGGLGRLSPEQVGPVETQRRNGVIDLVARDEPEAVRLAKACVAYGTRRETGWDDPDQRITRFVVPEDRLLAYDVGAVIGAIADPGSVLELQPDHARGMITCLVRVAGRPYGLIANDCRHLGGAIHVEGARKMRAFLGLCDSWRLPVVSLCDTPGFMVGPDSESAGAVRAFSELFVAGARLSVPVGTVILRKGYGLGAQAMAGGSFRTADFVVSWPTGEIGMMGLEGAVRLGFRKELEAIDDPARRQAAFDRHVADAYEAGRATNAAAAFELDDVIDPADTRALISTLDTRG